MSPAIKRFLGSINIVAECRRWHVSVFACPPFLFIIIGCVIIMAMVGTTILAQRFSDDPAVVVISVSLMTVFLFVIGHAVVTSFERLAEVSRMKSEFVNIVSHQLRAPLSGIRWQLELLEERTSKPLAESMEIIETLAAQNARMIGLVNDLLEVSRIEDDRLILRPIPVDMRQFVRAVFKQFEGQAAKARLKFTLDGDGGALFVFADESKLRWVTENLIENAIQYTRPGGAITVRVIHDGSARVEIEDSGIGIPARDQKKIFTKFFRAENANRLQIHGSGLGLFLVKSLIHAMNGKVGFRSEESAGSTFWYLLPVLKGKPELLKK